MGGNGSGGRPARESGAARNALAASNGAKTGTFDGPDTPAALAPHGIRHTSSLQTTASPLPQHPESSVMEATHDSATGAVAPMAGKLIASEATINKARRRCSIGAGYQGRMNGVNPDWWDVRRIEKFPACHAMRDAHAFATDTRFLSGARRRAIHLRRRTTASHTAGPGRFPCPANLPACRAPQAPSPSVARRAGA